MYCISESGILPPLLTTPEKVIKKSKPMQHKKSRYQLVFSQYSRATINEQNNTKTEREEEIDVDFILDFDTLEITTMEENNRAAHNINFHISKFQGLASENAGLFLIKASIH